MTTSIWFWIAFHIGVFIAIGIDLVTFKRRGRELSMRAAAQRTAIWIVLSLLFNLLVWKLRGPDKALEFLTGYVIEYSLSVDNIFVFVIIFAYFKVPPMAQHRTLVWGILGALIMRGIMILLGVTLVSRFHFILYIFGVFLVVTAVRMLFGNAGEPDFGKSLVMRFCRNWIPITPEFYGEDFKARVGNRWMLTPLGVALILVDVMDLIFAVDSIPAVFAITQDPFIVYTSNICAIVGLRSLYFLVARMMDRFIYLRIGLAFVLGFVGLKMIVAKYFPVPTPISLGIIVSILAVTIGISMLKTRNRAATEGRK
ncbi:MAG TPA: TerC family protein [Candidatus Udaeobacter sp.]|nr:TerC family protein [Candidatus Udaeobacter sp.]